MKTLYIDCFAGIAGDMFIGALLNLVPDAKILTDGIKKITALDPEEYELVIEHTAKNGIAGINFDVHLHEHRHHHEDSRFDMPGIIKTAANTTTMNTITIITGTWPT